LLGHLQGLVRALCAEELSTTHEGRKCTSWQLL